jgi:thiosulfate/3-mercaptopyruvate sulfurtransferase
MMVSYNCRVCAIPDSSSWPALALLMTYFLMVPVTVAGGGTAHDMSGMQFERSAGPVSDSTSAEPNTVALPAPVVSGDWLQARLGHPSLVILHVGADQDYADGHLPGAQLMKLADISVTGPTGLRLELPPVQDLVDALKGFGISNSSTVVIYHGTPSVQSATRTWFTLDYLGLSAHAALLDGGLALWKQEGRPVTTEPATRQAASALAVEPRPEVVASLASLQERRAGGSEPASSGVRLLDARLPEFYNGDSAGMAARAGHIPGARSIPYTQLFDEQGRWKSATEIRALLQPDGSEERPLVTYCHIGQQATVPYFAARMLGMEVQLFDGSFEEWARDESLPVLKVGQ